MTQAITRYDVRYLGDFPWQMAPFEDGDSVKFEDHLAALAPLARMWTPEMQAMPDDQPISAMTVRLPTVGEVKAARKMMGRE